MRLKCSLGFLSRMTCPPRGPLKDPLGFYIGFWILGFRGLGFRDLGL